MSRQFLVACCAAALAAAVSSAQANDIVFSFHGQITQVAYPSTTSFEVGDPFVLYLDFTPGGATPALGFYLNEGKRNGSALGIHNFLANIGGPSYSLDLDPPYWDANFSDPLNYRMYCYTYITFSAGTLHFGMFEEDTGAWGSVAVNSQFPADWLPTLADPLPGNLDTIDFDASGPLYVNYLNVGLANLTGNITAGSVSRLRQTGKDRNAPGSLFVSPLSATPAPEPASLAVLLLGAAALWPRRRQPRE